jgi:hypothetical protein
MSNRTKAAVAAAAICTTGCAMWRAGELPPLSGWPPSSEPGTKSVSLILSGRLIINGTEKDMELMQLKLWSDVALKQYHQSNLFSDVRLGLEETDLRAEIEVLYDEKVNLHVFWLSMFSWGLIPSSWSRRFSLTTTLRNAEGDTLGEITLTETVTLWQQTFLIFLLPFRFPDMTQACSDLHGATLLEAAAKGYVR